MTGFPVEDYVRNLHFAPTCCLVVRKIVCENAGLFDSRLISSGDKEFGLSNFIDGESRKMHDFHVPLLNMYGYRLHQDGKIRDRAWYWYQSRVVFSGVEEFCRKYYKKEKIYFDSRNINRLIKEYDIATGYPRRHLEQANE